MDPDQLTFYSPEHRRSVAYHEAGHAVIHWFFGTFGDFRGISMQPNSEFWGRVLSKSISWSPMIVQAAAQTFPQFAKANAMRIMMFNLAGPCAENMVGEKNPNWLDLLVDSEWWEDEESGNDISHAIQTAFAAVGRTGPKPWTLLRRVIARWTTGTGSSCTCRTSSRS